MANDFYNAGGVPSQGSGVTSPNIRAEFSAIQDGFNKLPGMTGNAYKIVYVNASGSAMDAIGGNGLLKLSTAGVPSVAEAGTDYLTPSYIHSAPNKSTLDDADEVGVQDSATSFSTKKFTVSNLKSLLKTYFDGQYASISGSVSQVFSIAAATLSTHAVRADQIQLQSLVASTTTGTAPDLAFSSSLGAGVAYAAWQRHTIKFSAAGATTLNRDALGAVALKRLDGSGSKVDFVSTANAIHDVQHDGTHYLVLNPLPSASGADPNLFYKADPYSVAFIKIGSGTATIKAGTGITVAGVPVVFANDTTIAMPTLTAGTDYAVWVKSDGTIQASSNLSTAPGSGNWRKAGGFYYGPGGMATGTSGGDTTPQIIATSFWDLKWRPENNDPRGMNLSPVGWVDMWVLNTDHEINGTSKFGATIADGSSPPKIPILFGGNGTTTYSSLTRFEAAEVMAAHGKRLITYEEFSAAAYGVTEGTSRGSDPVTCQLDAPRTSKFMYQATGNMWIFGANFGGGAAGPGWTASTGGRGSIYQIENTVILGGPWGSSTESGSRCSSWNISPTGSDGTFGTRGICNHLILL